MSPTPNRNLTVASVSKEVIFQNNCTKKWLYEFRGGNGGLRLQLTKIITADSLDILHDAVQGTRMQSSLTQVGTLRVLCFKGKVFGPAENSQCKNFIRDSNGDQLPF